MANRCKFTNYVNHKRQRMFAKEYGTIMIPKVDEMPKDEAVIWNVHGVNRNRNKR